MEDYNAVCMLRDLAETDSDQAAKAVVEKAIAYVDSKCITGMPREAADDAMEFNTLTEHSNAIRNTLEPSSRVALRQNVIECADDLMSPAYRR